MSASISITVGGNTVTRNYSVTNTKARDTLLGFYTAMGLGPAGATDTEKVTAIIDWFSGTIREKAILQHVEASKVTAQTEAETTYGLDV